MKIYKILPYIILLNLFIFYSCEFSPSLGVEGGEDTGFNIYFLNKSDVEYIGLDLYMGAIDKDGNFIAIDSLSYPDFKVNKKWEGDDVDEFRGDSKSYPFRFDDTGLDQYGVWVSNPNKITEISPENKITFKAILGGSKTTYSTPSTNIRVGTKIIIIDSDGSFFW